MKYIIYARKSTDVEDSPSLKLRTGRQKVFGLNLTLHAREARGVAEIQWASIAEAHQKISKTDTCLLLELEARFALATCGLQNRCSAIELLQHKGAGPLYH